MRKIKLLDQKVINVLNENTKINIDQEKVIAEPRVVEVKGKELEEKFKKNMAMSERIMERARPMVNKIIAKEKLAEYEYISKVSQDKKTKEWNIEIGNGMEEFKYNWEHRNDPKEDASK